MEVTDKVSHYETAWLQSEWFQILMSRIDEQIFGTLIEDDSIQIYCFKPTNTESAIGWGKCSPSDIDHWEIERGFSFWNNALT